MSQALPGTPMFTAISNVLVYHPDLTHLVALAPDHVLFFSKDGNMPAVIDSRIDTCVVMEAVGACDDYPSLHWIDVANTVELISTPTGPHIDLYNFENVMGANTAIDYGYRSDLSNVRETEVLKGIIPLAELVRMTGALIDGQRFLAPDGLPSLAYEEDQGDYIEEIDHPEHTLYRISLTHGLPTLDLSASDFAQALIASGEEQA